MPAYIVANIDVHDRDAYAPYVQEVPSTIRVHGGRYLARGGRAERLEGRWEPKRLVILEFESVERARGWYDSAEYAPLRAIREGATTSDIILVEGAAVS
jgi:uncharacterized protein (DUF1330 family)